MGTMIHHAIVVTSWKKSSIKRAADKARNIGLQVLGPSDNAINGYSSILICPDGGNEGWEDSDIGNERREKFKRWLYSRKMPFEYVEVAYGRDIEQPKITESSTEGR